MGNECCGCWCCCKSPKEDPNLISVEGSSEVAAAQADIAPYLFDLLKIQDYHPFLGTAEVVGEQLEGVGAKRKLTYKSGMSFFETVTATNGVDSITYELTEHVFPCETLYAHMKTARIDDEHTTLTSILEYKLKPGIPAEGAAKFKGQIQALAVGLANNVQAQFGEA